jgi:hypothetical protein
MKIQSTMLAAFAIFVISSCKPAISVNTTSTNTSSPILAQSIDDLSEMVYFSDPTVPQYNPNSEQYARFPEVIEQLENAGVESSSILAYAIRFPRYDSYLAAQSLLKMSPDIIATTVPILVDNLHSEKPDSRIYSVILLAVVGRPSSCAVGDIALLLWDSNPTVRSATALALGNITEQNLIANEYKVEITSSFTPDMIFPDTPEGKVVEKARTWWNEQGSKVNWHSTYGTCDP